MNHVISRSLLVLLIVTSLAACDKKDEPPAPPASVPAPAAAPVQVTSSAPVDAAPAVPASQVKKASLDCDDRTIVLEATCSPLNGPSILACTKQSLTVMTRPGGAVQAARHFTPQPAADGDPPLVDEKISALSCERSNTASRYIVADMFNGGNCAECEWQEVYDWDGNLVASNRDRKKTDPVFNSLVGDARDRAIGKKELDGFYVAAPR
jgi:predicted small lipoprotein YifL